MRSKFRWNVTLQCEDGQIVEYPIAVFWDPEREGAAEAVMRTAKAEATHKTGKQHHPIAAARV